MKSAKLTFGAELLPNLSKRSRSGREVRAPSLLLLPHSHCHLCRTAAGHAEWKKGNTSPEADAVVAHWPLCVIVSPKLALPWETPPWLSGSPTEVSANTSVNSVEDLLKSFFCFDLTVHPELPSDGTACLSRFPSWVGASKLPGLVTVSSTLARQDGGHARAPNGSSLPRAYIALLQPASPLPHSPGGKQATGSSYIHPLILRNTHLALPGSPLDASLSI